MLGPQHRIEVADVSAVGQLTRFGLPDASVLPITTKDGVHVYRVLSGTDVFILKVFDNPADRREIGNYLLLKELGVPTLPMLNHTESALLLPDVDSCGKYRLGVQQDLSDENVARSIARWYKTLHDHGRQYVASHGGCLYDETDVITLGHLNQVASKTNTLDNPVWQFIHQHFAQLRHQIDTLPRTLTYNDFYWTNLLVARDGASAMMLDFNLLGRGYVFGDVRNVTSALVGGVKQAFLDEYGPERISDDEVVADKVLSPLVSLCVAGQREHWPEWAEPCRDELDDGTLFEHLRRWISSS